jgi:hypothetical protein
MYTDNLTLDQIMSAMMTTGFQATNMGLAIDEINRMVNLYNPSLVYFN